MNDLKEYYETYFAPNFLPATHRKPYDEVSKELKDAMDNSLDYSTWRVRKRFSELFALAFGEKIQKGIGGLLSKFFW